MLLHIIFIVVLLFVIFYLIYQKHSKNKSKILIFTIETRDLDYLDYHNINVDKYAQKFNYDYRFYNNYFSNLPVYWWKMQCIKDLFELNDIDYIMWLDSDTIFLKNIPIEALIEKSPNASIFIGKDYPELDGYEYPFCAGVFIIKNNDIGIQFIDDCLNHYINNQECKDENGTSVLKGQWAGSCYEQGVINIMLDKYKNHYYEIGHDFLINSRKFNDKPVIMHLFDDKTKCLEFFKKYI